MSLITEVKHSRYVYLMTHDNNKFITYFQTTLNVNIHTVYTYVYRKSNIAPSDQIVQILCACFSVTFKVYATAFYVEENYAYFKNVV